MVGRCYGCVSSFLGQPFHQSDHLFIHFLKGHTLPVAFCTCHAGIWVASWKESYKEVRGRPRRKGKSPYVRTSLSCCWLYVSTHCIQHLTARDSPWEVIIILLGNSIPPDNPWNRMPVWRMMILDLLPAIKEQKLATTLFETCESTHLKQQTRIPYGLHPSFCPLFHNMSWLERG